MYPKSILIVAGMLLLTTLLSQTTVTYLPSIDDFPNPERGFYRYSETRSGNYTPLVQSELESWRNVHTPPTAGYTVQSTLVFRYFFLEDFRNSAISQSYLDNVTADFATARAAGVKLIPRFAYTDAVDGSTCGNFICPPYGDADKARILGHIAQLQPILTANADVIAALQMGFIGVWGEQYYTDHFGDASGEGQGQLLDQNWNDRNEVLGALLNALPDRRAVQVRYPQLKQRYVYGISAPVTAAALTAGEAYNETDKARIGLHNDCLLASSTDYGTYFDYGRTGETPTSDTTNLKPYVAAEGQYVPMGGETCDDSNYDSQNNCTGTNATAFGDTELRRLHYSYLNSQYNNDVNNDWQTGGCMDEIKRRLGYRFALQSGTYADAGTPGRTVELSLQLTNEGYAAPFNPRGVEFVLRNTTTNATWFATLPDDPRTWQPGGNHSVAETLCLPADLPTGDYALLLNLPDPETTLYADPDYSIRTANRLPGNADGWEAATGFNQLGHTITVSNGTAGAPCNGEITFAATSAILPVRWGAWTAQYRHGAVLLNWETLLEANADYFDVERSTDARDWTPLGRVAAAGNTTMTQRYAWTDREVRSGNRYYYRLRQVDRDGTAAYSAVRSVLVSEAITDVRLFPNPTAGLLQIALAEGAEPPVGVRVRNALGARVLELPFATEISLAELPGGTYSVELLFTDSQRIFQRVVKF